MRHPEYGMVCFKAALAGPNVASAPASRRVLQEAFYFRPSPDVSRVVFIETPHRGSSWAHRPVGRLGSALVETSAESESVHTQLVHDNPNLFREELIDRFPSSVDLLKPASLLLAATTNLPCSPAVRLHTIYGVSKTTWEGGQPMVLCLLPSRVF